MLARPMTIPEARERIAAFHAKRDGLYAGLLAELGSGAQDPDRGAWRIASNQRTRIGNRQAADKDLRDAIDRGERTNELHARFDGLDATEWRDMDDPDAIETAVTSRGTLVKSEAQALRDMLPGLLEERLDADPLAAWVIDYRACEREAERLSDGLAVLEETYLFSDSQPTDEELERLLGTVTAPVLSLAVKPLGRTAWKSVPASKEERCAEYQRRRELHQAEQDWLTGELDALIATMRAEGMGAPRIARELGVHVQTIYYMEKRSA